MPYENPEALVSTEWLAAHLEAPDVHIVDGSWHMPAAKRDARAEYDAQHIPGAVLFDIDAIADTGSDLPHMLPGPEDFAALVGGLGLGDGNRIVVYDTTGVSAAARVWWMFRVFGHDDVAVLDGGLAKWLQEGRSVSDQPVRPQQRHFTPRVNTFLVRDYGQVRANVERRREQFIDTRSAGRFDGSAPEPRPELRSGHAPGSLNLPYTAFLNRDKTMVSADAIRAALDAAGVDRDRPMFTSCGSGVTACIVSLGLYLIGNKDVPVFDGSWTEWASHPDAPIEPS
ncbi:MAG: 3-mercaptopyruvate sulfurtransferase [Alphaproteobacteria bacterium]|nr:3-mercaptopyruvate sulfurtransferase [Alphaproteobacteria bacterium]